MFSFGSDVTLRRDYIKEQFYTQAAQYADKAKADNGNKIIVFSAPYKAPSKRKFPDCYCLIKIGKGRFHTSQDELLNSLTSMLL